MSTDYDIVCGRCRRYAHIGQRVGGGFSFGYGSNDQGGRDWVGAWILKHTHCGPLVFVWSEHPALDGMQWDRDDGKCSTCGHSCMEHDFWDRVCQDGGDPLPNGDTLIIEEQCDAKGCACARYVQANDQ